MAKSLQDTVTAWTNSGGQAGTAYVAGIRASTAPITSAAIANQGAMVSNFNQAVTSGRWANNLNAVGDQNIKQAAIDKVANYTNGFQQGATKFSSSMSVWLPRIDAAAAMARALPATVGGPNNNRSAAFATALWNQKRGL